MTNSIVFLVTSFLLLLSMSCGRSYNVHWRVFGSIDSPVILVSAFDNETSQVRNIKIPYENNARLYLPADYKPLALSHPAGYDVQTIPDVSELNNTNYDFEIFCYKPALNIERNQTFEFNKVEGVTAYFVTQREVTKTLTTLSKGASIQVENPVKEMPLAELLKQMGNGAVTFQSAAEPRSAFGSLSGGFLVRSITTGRYVWLEAILPPR